MIVRLLGPSCIAAGLVLTGCGDDGGRGDSTATTQPGTASTASPTSEPTTSTSSTSSTSSTTALPTGTTDDTATTGPVATTTTDATSTTTTGASTTLDTEGTTGSCLDVLPTPAGPEAVLAAEYAADYVAYDLGPVPRDGGGVLPRLGGLVVFPDDPLMAYVVGPSEVDAAELHVVPLERGPCGHIIGFGGGAVKLLGSPYLDLMTNGPKGVVFISHYPTNMLSQIVPGAPALASTIDLGPLGVEATWSPGGLNFVPPGYPDAGMLRIMGYPYMQQNSVMGSWYRADITYNGTSYDIAPVEKTVELPGGPGGFAYIPAGSPGFPEQRIMVTEWLTQPRRVSSYAVDAEGDPIVDSHKPFFESFVNPWGSYFEPETGDYIFLQWEAQPDHVYIVQGFVPPPPIPG
ncbi:hypothetical protein [Nannocystis bainbridge]|uniref:Uncharacterized protein n=1 Tax=Nannocystis bainbridge TaxID=2995303 RepID=A0ABT5DTU8_9BACT|nr:hypothetical protein [Nannocystis bainbridge]MDC0716585.1 hypothetical protein [Nannocystis bainbridge]